MKPGPPFFSIILPVYNVAPYLRACLDSLLSQTFTDWECLCVDDGSTDGSGVILDDYAARDARFRVFHQPNRGVSKARNHALNHLSGQYVYFVDGDDCLYPWGLERLERTIQETGADLVRSRFLRYNSYASDGRYDADGFTQYSSSGAVMTWGWETFCRDGYAWAFTVRRNCIGKIRFPEDVCLKEDVIFDLALLPQCQTAVQMDAVIYWYRRRVNSAVRMRETVSGPLDRIAHYKQLALYQSQKQEARAAIVAPLTKLLFREWAVCVIAGGAALLPKLIQEFSDLALLDLNILPKRWAIALRWCQSGHPWFFVLQVWISHLKWSVLHPLDTVLGSLWMVLRMKMKSVLWQKS